jgi:hypothetical protein
MLKLLASMTFAQKVMAALIVALLAAVIGLAVTLGIRMHKSGRFWYYKPVPLTGHTPAFHYERADGTMEMHPKGSTTNGPEGGVAGMAPKPKAHGRGPGSAPDVSFFPDVKLLGGANERSYFPYVKPKSGDGMLGSGMEKGAYRKIVQGPPQAPVNPSKSTYEMNTDKDIDTRRYIQFFDKPRALQKKYTKNTADFELTGARRKAAGADMAQTVGPSTGQR